ncbi:MAG: SDR family oxidoreductase, partial [Bacteroidota bacterium]
EAKLKRQPREKPLSRRVALISGGGGGIGKAIADRLVAEGAVVVLTDLVEDRVKEARGTFGRDQAAYHGGDITNAAAVQAAFDTAALAFGGVDIVVHSAGLAISKGVVEYEENEYDLLNNVIAKGQFLLAQEGVKTMRKQGFGGDIISIASKNALFAGPNNVPYGTAKAAQTHMARLLAAELAGDQIRVNVVNPDAVIVGSKIWEGEWAEGRAKAYGVAVEDLPKHYAQRNLLKAIILPDDIANAVYAFLVELTKSTGNILNVDGGIAASFTR